MLLPPCMARGPRRLPAGERSIGRAECAGGRQNRHTQFVHPDGNSRQSPQQFLRPHAVSFESSPFMGLSVIRTEPVLTKPLGFLPDLAYSATASMPIEAIL